MKSKLLRVLVSLASVCGIGTLYGCGGGTAQPPPPPSVTISASASSVVLGQTVTLTWSATNVTACTASSNPSQGDWSGSVAVSGTRSVSPGVAEAITYSLACAGTGGNASKSVMVQGTTPVQALTITSANARAGTAGLGYGDLYTVLFSGVKYTGRYFRLSASGGSGSYVWSWTAAASSVIPAGLDCCTARISAPFPLRSSIPVNGAIQGTPKVAGMYHVVLTVSDAAAATPPVSQNFAIVVGNPVINTIPAPTIGTLNSPFAGFNFVATGGVQPLTWSETGTLPDGLTLSADGLLSGMPTKAGAFPVSIKMTDGAGNVAAPQDFTLQVLAKGFAPTGSMAAARQYHTATLLASGKVLVAGGSGLASTELFDPGTGTFSASGDMGAARSGHTATLLNNGKVLIAGGQDATGVNLATAELYDPAAGTFSSTGSMTTGREFPTATLLADGRVLVTGGYIGPGATATATAEVYDPTAGMFSPVGDMGTDRSAHTATLLGDGRVLIAGGATAAAELFDPKSKTFSATGPLQFARIYPTATVLASGKVLVAGGEATAELYDPASGTFSETGPMETPRINHTATLLSNGKVLVTGGTVSAAELFDPASVNFTRTADLTTARAWHTATRLTNGQVLVTGGASTDGTVLATAELYQF
jgi:hypothetical protein